jgi:hypothetical protein
VLINICENNDSEIRKTAISVIGLAILYVVLATLLKFWSACITHDVTDDTDEDSYTHCNAGCGTAEEAQEEQQATKHRDNDRAYRGVQNAKCTG